MQNSRTESSNGRDLLLAALSTTGINLAEKRAPASKVANAQGPEDDDDPFSAALKELDDTNLKAEQEIKQKKAIVSVLSAPIAPIRAHVPIPLNIRASAPLQVAIPRWLNPEPVPTVPMPRDVDEVAVAEDEELGYADTYADYTPAKVRGLRHPDSVVETSSLSSVEPPDVSYHLVLPVEVVSEGRLSALQTEAVIYACQKHEQRLPSGERAGFLVGDGAGVGKGRTIAGIIFENYLRGRKRSLWLSVSNDLRFDSQRDLRDIGAKIEVHALNKFKYGSKLSSRVNGSVKKGVLFATYASLIGESNSSSKYGTRLNQIVQWLGRDFDGVIVLDECHRAKNLLPGGPAQKPSKTGEAVKRLQEKIPNARLVYASATGASEPRHMAYMQRLGLWGKGAPFPTLEEFLGAVQQRGVGGMEIVAMDMKRRGVYLARQLSFNGVTFRVEEVPLARDFVQLYDDTVQLWVDLRDRFSSASELVDPEGRQRKTMWGQFWSAHQRFFKYLCISAKVPHAVRLAKDAVKAGKCVVIGLQSTGEARTLDQMEEQGGELNEFVSTAKGVLQTLIEKHFPTGDPPRDGSLLDLLGIGDEWRRELGRTPPREQAAQPALVSSSSSSDEEDGQQTTHDDDDDFNPFRMDDDDDETDPWLRGKRPAASPSSRPAKKPAMPAAPPVPMPPPPPPPPPSAPVSAESSAQVRQWKHELLQRVDALGKRLPANALDELIDALGGPTRVAEMTGRKGRLVSTPEGTVQYEYRAREGAADSLNVQEKERFMKGDKLVAIISEAASSGISLQADRRALNQRRRVHLTLELPWAADRAIQQFGRTHRSNQVSSPEYVLLISKLAGEHRFAATVAKRLESLGALTHGDRRATESRDLSRFNIDTKYGREALDECMKALIEMLPPPVPIPSSYPSDRFFSDARRALCNVGLLSATPHGAFAFEKDFNNVPKFLNRLLGVHVTLQNALFQFLLDVLESTIQRAKQDGRFDLGILDLGANGERVDRVATYRFVLERHGCQAQVELHHVRCERGISFANACDVLQQGGGARGDGFYIAEKERGGRRLVVLVVALSGQKHSVNPLCCVYKPATGLQPRREHLTDIKGRFRRVELEDGRPHWETQWEAAASHCMHRWFTGHCKRQMVSGERCELGLRTRSFYFLSGAVLSVWADVERLLGDGPSARMQLVRVKAADGTKLVGCNLAPRRIPILLQRLSEAAVRTQTEKFDEDPLAKLGL